MTFEMTAPDDFHVHLREGEALNSVAYWTAQQFARALVMPNLAQPITTPAQVASYREAINGAVGTTLFTPLMTFYANESVKPEDVAALKLAGAVAGKYYPKGVTTGSEAGSDFEELYPLFEAMQQAGLVLCIHGEVPGKSVLNAESAFITYFHRAAKNFPRLRFVFEHVTTEFITNYIRYTDLDNVAATITAHHLLLTIDDVVGAKIQPHHFCKPIAKTRDDRTAVLRAALSGDPKFFFGSDSAPHTIATKECASGCAGVFSAPVALQTIAEIFDEADQLDRLEAFTSFYGADFYGLSHNTGKVVLERRSAVADEFVCGSTFNHSHDYRVFRGGETLKWAFVERT